MSPASLYLMGVVRSLVPALALFATGLQAQMVVDPATLRPPLHSFQTRKGDVRLQCRIQPVRPSLNLGFRFQTGYRIELPLKHYSGERNAVGMVLRVTPQNSPASQPVYLASRVRIPAVPDKKAVMEFSGGYLVGEGEYEVEMLVADEQDHACTATWTIKARMPNSARNVSPGLPPGAVDDFSMRTFRKPNPIAANDRPRKIAVLVHASSMIPFRSRMRDYDKMLLISALSSLAERLPGTIRLSLFSMDKQKELYHTPELSWQSFEATVDKLNELELGTVEYSTLLNRTGHIALLTNLLKRETRQEEAPDAIVFLGPFAHSIDRVPSEILPSAGIPVYNIQLHPWRMNRNLGSDTVTNVTKTLGGKTRVVYSADDFAEAIKDIERLLAAPARTSALLHR